jgi:dipeptidyl aminopeptidase/acylaminoacyl peptidase
LKKLVFILFIGSIFMTMSANENNHKTSSEIIEYSGYKTPPQNIQEIFNKERPPYYSFVRFKELGLEINYLRYQTLEQISDPTVKLAGEEISIRLNASSKKYPLNYFAIHNFETNEKIVVDFPKDIKIREYKLSLDHSQIAFSYETENGVQILTVKTATGAITYYVNLFLNDAFGDDAFWWMKDNKTLLLKLIPVDRGKIPMRPIVPTSPVIEETSGKVSTSRTYQNLLKDKHDELLFDYFFTSQIATLKVKNKKLKIISNTAVWDEIKLSPDNQHIYTNKINKPYSYQLPYYRFPQTLLVMDNKGEKLQTIYERPLQDQIPIGGTYKGPRRFRWQPLKNASLVWVEALDEGNPKVDVDHRDKVMQLSAPFNHEAEEIFRTTYRFSSIQWSEVEDELIFGEYDRDRIWMKYWLYDIKAKKSDLLFDMSRRERYNFPGKLVMKKTNSGKEVFIKRNNYLYYDNDIGATPEGNFPYLSKFNLETKEKEILWQCQPDHYETFLSFLNDDLTKVVIRSESNEKYRNYYFIDLISKKRQQITDYPNPYPEITDLKTELITYPRADSIPLSGTLILPADHKQGERLPLILEAYPQEYVDASTAGQITGSANRFPNFWGASIRYFVLEGYAVLLNASIPIVGDPETVNETFIEQTVSSVKAAIEYLDEREIIDPKRVGVTGHSYGAFMVANVLAHSDLCAAGIAKSGAYNRSLTPFGFQSERRTFWEAKDFYVEVSPFMQAEKINEPLLLIHGEDDPNSGTYPLQSKRFYQALKGNGATAKLVLLPKEGHGYFAKESLLHVLAEQLEWLDKYVKNRKTGEKE